LKKIWVALLLVGCGGAVEPSICEDYTAAELDGLACTQIGKRCAFDVDGKHVAPAPEAAVKCECLGTPLTYQCGPRTWP